MNPSLERLASELDQASLTLTSTMSVHVSVHTPCAAQRLTIYCCFSSPKSANSNTVPTGSEAAALTPAISLSSAEQVVTPWDVQGQVAEDGQQLAINYDKLIDQFGTRRIDTALLERFEKITGHKPHPLLRRGAFFSHRCAVMYRSLPIDLISH